MVGSRPARRLLAGGPASVDAAFAALGGGYVRK